MSVLFEVGADSCTITKNPSFGKNWWHERYNQYVIDTADGGRKIYDNGPDVLKGEIVLRNVSKAEGDALRTFLETKAIYGKNAIDITPPTNTDIGAGAGTKLSSAYFDGPNTLEGVLSYHEPGLYDIVIPYRK